MSKARFSILRAFVIFASVIAVTWAYQRWFNDDEIIRVNGGAAEVIDGDSFKVGKEEFRIYGVDAPEYRQMCKDENGADWACGKTSRAGLDRILRKQDHSCTIHARDRFGRNVVLCTSEEGQDLSAALVTAGLALSGQHFDEIIYASDEGKAQKAKRGIWRGKFVRPDEWRAQNPRN